MSRHVLADAFEVLVVDDEPDLRDLLVDYFKTLGFGVSWASDGRAAVLAIERDPARFGLIVTDLAMPEVDGFGVLMTARRLCPACYVVIVTGFASLDSAIQAVRSGAYDYLPKPFALGQLDVILKRIADHAQLDRASREKTAAGTYGLPRPAHSQPARAAVAMSAAELAWTREARASSTAAVASAPVALAPLAPAPASSQTTAAPATIASIDTRLRAIEAALDRVERQLSALSGQ